MKSTTEVEVEIQSPCSALALRQWLTKASSLVQPSFVTKGTQAFLKEVEWEAYEGNVLWEFTSTRFMILLSLLMQSSKGKVKTYGDVWPYLMVLSMPDEVARHIKVDLENGTFTGMPGLIKAFKKKGMGKCTNTLLTSGSKASRMSMPGRKKKRSKG